MQECPRCQEQVKDGIRFCPKCGAGLASWTGRLRPGDVLIDRYTIVRPLARGGMGAVYLATDNRLGDAPMAVKEMTPHHSPGDTQAWERAVTEFRREASLLARLSHPNLPHVIDQFSRDDNEFLVMELVSGHNLRNELDQRTDPVPLAEALDWFRQLTGVLSYLHQQTPPIIYRDLKPPNIMVRPDGRIVLIDFGIARLYKPDQTSDTAIYGTPGYAPPEQYGLGQTDARTDVYALAMVFYEVLTRFEPAKRVTSRPPLAHTLRQDLAADLSKTLHKALSPDPDERFSTMDEFRDAVLNPSALVRTVSSGQLKADVAATDTPTKQTPNQPPSTTTLHSRRTFWIALATVITLALMAGAWVGFGPDSMASTTPTVTPVNLAGVTPSVPNETVRPTSTPFPELPPAPAGMVGIPEGKFVIGDDNGQPDEQPKGTGFLELFYIDRTEVTVAAYRECVDAGVCTLPSNLSSQTRPEYFQNPQYDQFPVIWVTWEQSRTYCGWRDKRLPTEAEWEKAARGSEGLLYPWGNQWQDNRAHLWGSADGGDTTQVGSIPEGTSPFGAVDMVGNVWEWTSSLDQPYPYSSGDGRELVTDPGSRIIRGGSWGREPSNARASDRDRRMPNDPNFNLGFRCATSKPFAPVGMDFIPGGAFTLGSTTAQQERWKIEYGWEALTNEEPTTIITMTAFYLDHTEVTNQQYARFITETGHPIPRNSFDPDGLALWKPDGTFPADLANHPVVNVTWDDARKYCAWAEKRLPTEVEWERAARGTDGRLWPWGETWFADRSNTSDLNLGKTTPVGSYPAGAGPYGSLDLAGNAWEWTSSLNRPYPYVVTDSRENPNADGSRILRGGSWLDTRQSARTTGRNALRPDLANVNVGFRCVQEIER